jgi:UDP-glucose:(heptosyl)LPS alpha-1,3-glucosyltransferase
MKKIAFIIQLFQNNNFHGGGEKLFYRLIKKFIENNYIVDVYCSKSNVQEFHGINKIVVVDKPYNHLDPEIMETFYEEAEKLISQENYDSVISENITPPIDITFLQGHSLVHRQYKLKNPIESFLYNFRPVKRKRIIYQQKWLHQGYRRIFAVSQLLKNDIITNFNIPEEKISVVYPGVDIPEEMSLKDDRKQNKSDIITFGLSAPGFKIKGGYVFLEALKTLKNKGYDFRAKIIYPKFKKNLWIKLLLKAYGIKENVEFLGFQSDMQNFYNSLDCIVVPSIEDSFNLVVLEAMANKKPCIVSSYAGAGEILKDGHDGFVFDMQEKPVQNLADKMAFIIDNAHKTDEYSKNAFETAKNYSWDKFYEAFIKELLKLK